MIEEKKVTTEEAVLIGVVTQHQDEEQSNEYLDELEFLTLTAGGKAVKRFTQKLEIPKKYLYISSTNVTKREDPEQRPDLGLDVFPKPLRVGHRIERVNLFFYFLKEM